VRRYNILPLTFTFSSIHYYTVSNGECLTDKKDYNQNCSVLCYVLFFISVYNKFAQSIISEIRSSDVTLLDVLDLSAAFDTVDHSE